MNKSWNPVYTKLLIGLGIIAGLCWLLHAALNSMVNRALPPEGFVFERLPVLTGVYECCGLNEQYPESTVNQTTILCSSPGFFNGFGQVARNGSGSFVNACWLEKELNGQLVKVEEIITPVAPWESPPRPIVSKITSQDKIFYERSDRLLREQWLKASTTSISNFVFDVFFIAFFFLVCIFRESIPLFSSKKE